MADQVDRPRAQGGQEVVVEEDDVEQVVDRVDPGAVGEEPGNGDRAGP